MTDHVRRAGLPVVALLLVSGVLGVQVANGGGTFEPLQPADACTPRTVTSVSGGIEGVTELLVLLAVDDAACTLQVSREALTLELAQPGPRSAAEIDALHEGLLAAVRRMKEDGSLPPASELVDEALDNTDLNPLLETAIRAIPDAALDAALRTDDVLVRAVDNLDLRALLANLDDQDDLNEQLEAAITRAVRESLVARLRDLL